MGHEDEAPDRRPRFTPPRWMAPVLLLASLPGFVVLLVALWLSFVGGGPYADPAVPPPARLPFVDRAVWWVGTGPGSTSSVATLVVLAALVAVVLTRHDDRTLHPALRSAAFWTTAAFAVLEVSGPVAVVAGYVQLVQDPTLVRTSRTEIVDVAALAVSLVLAVVAGVLAWVSAWNPRWADRLARPVAPSSQPLAAVGELAAEHGRRDVELHWQDEGSVPLEARRRRARPWPGWLALAGVAAVLVVVPSLVQRETAPAPIELPQVTPTPTTASATTTRVVVPDLGPEILGVTDQWELFALGDNSVTQIQLAAGRITTTYFAPLQSTGPVSFVVGGDRAIVKPLDAVPGYVVPDTGPVRGLTGLLGRGVPALPASDPNQLWVGPEDSGPPVMTLTDLDGSRVLAVTSVPAGAAASGAAGDGAGFPLFRGVGGSYVARPGGVQRISTGLVVATGPSGWLAHECDEHGRCTTVAIDRATGERRVLPVGIDGDGPPGVLSPDGTYAALVVGLQDGATALRLADLATGSDHDIGVRPAMGFGPTMVWSPDGRWLFVVDDTGHLHAVDPRSRQVNALPGPVPLLRQLAIRTGR